MIGGVRVYIEPQDILSRLPEEDRKRFNSCYITDVKRDSFGAGLEIECLLLNDEDSRLNRREERRLVFRNNTESED